MLNFRLKLSDLKLDFTLTLGYLNPALNNPAWVDKQIWKCGPCSLVFSAWHLKTIFGG